MRITDAIVQKGTLYSSRAPSLNLAYGGQHGHMPRIGTLGADGKHYEEWISNQAYVQKNVIPILLTYPRFFDFMPPSPKVWIRTLKSIMEQHPLTIDGLNQTLSIETDQHSVGGAGEMQDEFTKVNRAPSTPSFTWQEKAGESLTRFWEWYVMYGIQDPDTGMANVRVYLTEADYDGIYTPDFYSFSMMFIEPDSLGKVVNRVWLLNNMFPKSLPDVTGKRDIKSAGSMKEISIEFAALATPPSVATHAMAEQLLASMNIISKIPNYDSVLPVASINPSVADANTGFDS